MRNFIISFICLFIIVFTWTCFDFYASARTDYYENTLATITNQYINRENWTEAKTAFKELHSEWKDYRHIASFFLDANDLNHIDNTFRKAEYYISACDRSNSAGELAYLKGLFIALHKNESISPANIF